MALEVHQLLFRLAYVGVVEAVFCPTSYCSGRDWRMISEKKMSAALLNKDKFEQSASKFATFLTFTTPTSRDGSFCSGRMHMIKKWQMNPSHRMRLSAAQQFFSLVISNTKHIVVHFLSRPTAAEPA